MKTPRVRPSVALLSLTVVATLTACVSAPTYEAPTLPQATTFLAIQTTGQTEVTTSSPALAQHLAEGRVERTWWRTFGSPVLDALIEEGLSASPTLASAQFALDQAREIFAAQRAVTQLPQADLGVSTQRQQISPSAQGVSGEPREFSLYSTNVAVRYRFDFGGSTDSGLRALAARTDVRSHELTAAQHTLAAMIATSAITLARLADQIEVQTAIVGAQAELVQLAQVRSRLGQAVPAEVDALAAPAEVTHAGLALLRKQLRQTEHLLATLVGRPPSQGVPALTLADFSLPREIPVSVPSEWATERPDIRAAEAALRAAHADLGVAYARQYPQLTISASIGSQALATSALFGGAAAVWGAAGQLTQPLLNAGLPAERRAAQAAFSAAQARYQQVVLAALRDVADALRAVELDAQSQAALLRGNQALQAQHQLLKTQLLAGTANKAQLLAGDQLLMQSRMGLITAQAQRLINTVALNAALVGGP